MRIKLTPLHVIEILALAGLVVLGIFLVLEESESEQLVPLTDAALVTGPGQEIWYGIFLDETHVGFSVNRNSPITLSEEDNKPGTLYESRAQFRFPYNGSMYDVITANQALLDSESRLVEFDLLVSVDLSVVSARGQVLEDEIRVELARGQQISVHTVPIDEPPHLDLTLESIFRGRELTVGDEFPVAMFSPLSLVMAQQEVELPVLGKVSVSDLMDSMSLSQFEMTMRVDDVEVLSNGEEAYWVSSSFMGSSSRALITSNGVPVRQENGFGLSLTRMTAEDAQAALQSETETDWINLVTVPLKGKIRRPRHVEKMEVVQTGAALSMDWPVTAQQQVMDNRIIVQSTDISQYIEQPIADTSNPAWVASTWTLPVGNDQLRSQALTITADATNRREAVLALLHFVDSYVINAPNLGFTHGLQTFLDAKGDSNEHTALFVTMARAIGIPCRISTGVVYNNRTGNKPAFYYHAWAEVLMDTQDGWVSVDPTFRQFPPTAHESNWWPMTWIA